MACVLSKAPCAQSQESCCGETFDSVACECFDGKWICRHTDACMRPDCGDLNTAAPSAALASCDTLRPPKLAVPTMIAPAAMFVLTLRSMTFQSADVKSTRQMDVIQTATNHFATGDLLYPVLTVDAVIMMTVRAMKLVVPVGVLLRSCLTAQLIIILVPSHTEPYIFTNDCERYRSGSHAGAYSRAHRNSYYNDTPNPTEAVTAPPTNEPTKAVTETPTEAVTAAVTTAPTPEPTEAVTSAITTAPTAAVTTAVTGSITSHNTDIFPLPGPTYCVNIKFTSKKNFPKDNGDKFLSTKSGEVLYEEEAGFMKERETEYLRQFCNLARGSYTLVVTDSGAGMFAEGNGSYVVDIDGQVILVGGRFRTEETSHEILVGVDAIMSETDQGFLEAHNSRRRIP
ncbi:hypothetical protein QTG54_014120 [Skeletonema marinoi]|uniref:Uncharacterized protein n=1 Tax=Skeletonema marinoi TaxID=267567 RepID=A0AAD8XWA7_9STRA|nr:hypothetical protein QTG54_014120 [Skeletonema marinoi]